MFLEATLQDFLDPNSFLVLQNKFQLQDEKNFFDENLVEIIKQDIVITYKYYDQNNVEDFKRMSFYEEIIIPAATKLSEKYIDIFNFKIQSHFKYNIEERQEFIKSENKRFFDFALKVKSVDFYAKEILEIVDQEIEKISDYLASIANSQI